MNGAVFIVRESFNDLTIPALTSRSHPLLKKSWSFYLPDGTSDWASTA